MGIFKKRKKDLKSLFKKGVRRVIVKNNSISSYN